MKTKIKSLKLVLVSVLVFVFFLVLSASIFSCFTTLKESQNVTGSQNLSVSNSEMKKMELPSYYTIFRFFITKIPFKADKN